MKRIYKIVQRVVRGVFVLLSLVFILASCSETKEVRPSDLGYDYYPIELGQYRVYEVEEILYNLIGFDTLVYQLRETFFDTLVSGGRVRYLIRRDTRSNELESWKSDSVWTASVGPAILSVTENNIPFVKLAFPVTVPKEWDGNSLNSKAEMPYYYQELTTSIIDSIPKEDHIRVVIEDIQENVTGVDLRSEVYVKGVGLVEKDYLTQERCTASNCGAELGSIISGRSLKQTLIEVGNE